MSNNYQDKYELELVVYLLKIYLNSFLNYFWLNRKVGFKNIRLVMVDSTFDLEKVLLIKKCQCQILLIFNQCYLNVVD